MKLMTLFILTLMTLTLPSFTNAGTVSGGGGSVYAAKFSQRAELIFKRLVAAKIDQAMIDDLKKSLADAEIVVVDTLTLESGEEVPDQKYLVAYGRPGEIQLKANYWVDQDQSRIWTQSDHHILHEITRSSLVYGDVDKTYSLSIGIMQLDKTTLPYCIISESKFTGNMGVYTYYSATVKIINSTTKEEMYSDSKQSKYSSDTSYNLELMRNVAKQLKKGWQEEGICHK